MMPRWLCATKLWRNRDGAVAIEMAFAVPIFLLFLIGFIGFGHVYWIYNSMQYAADQGARYAMINPTASDTAVADVVRTHMPGIDTTPLTVTITSQSSGGLTSHTIALSYSYSFMHDIASFLPSSLTTQVTVPIIQ